MQIVAALRDVDSFDRQRRRVFHLRSGQRYVLFDFEARAAAGQGVARTVGPLEAHRPRYAGEPLGDERLFVPFIGGYGDAVLLGTCLAALQQAFPECRMDIAAPARVHPVLELLDVPLTILDHPLALHCVDGYDFFMSLEQPERYGDPRTTGNVEIFRRCLQSPPPAEAVGLRLPEEAIVPEWLAAAPRPRVGLALSRTRHMRSYPPEWTLRLARRLVETGLCVVLLGVGSEIEHPLPHAPPLLINAVDHTPAVADLALALSGLDLLVCPDSFFLHLAGALRLQTLALFSSSSERVADGYSTVRTCSAPVACRPCGAAAADCPEGHARCVVFEHPVLDPLRVAAAVESRLRGRGTLLLADPRQSP